MAAKISKQLDSGQQYEPLDGKGTFRSSNKIAGKAFQKQAHA